MVRRIKAVRTKAILNLYVALGVTTVIFKIATGDTAEIYAWNDWIAWSFAMFYVVALFGLAPNFLTEYLMKRFKSPVRIAWLSGLASAASVLIVNSIAVVAWQNGEVHSSWSSILIYFASIIFTVALGVWYALRAPRPVTDEVAS